ncbi:glycosyltransferase [Flavobacterium sp. XS2P12]|uniref:glycosyltransferase n=1 Tax=Flavobacterium melibiosi TaxID=3398734 RepID=UPI003A850E51
MREVKGTILPLVSVVIPCYNDAEFIEQSINSALNQTYSNIEVIVVDDGSNIETKVVLKKLEPKITKLITQENQGQSTARNVGIIVTKGEYVLVLDSDDFFEPTFCEKAIVYFENDTTIKIITSYVSRLQLNGQNDVFEPIGGNIKNFLKYNCATGSAMFKKKDWEQVRGYDEDMRQGFEDWEFYIRLLKDGGYAYIIQEPLFNYRIKENSTTTKANKGKYNLLKYIYTKHQKLYKENFELLVNHLLHRIEKEEIEKVKNTKRIDFIIGNYFLIPFRSLKNFFLKSSK